jgi:signal peptidase I
MLKPFDWSGTATRANYWVLYVSFIVAVICFYVVPSDLPIFGVILLALAVLQVLMISVAVRRLHDFGRSGMWVILTLVPFLGLVVSLWIGWAKGKPEQDTAWPPERRYRVGQGLAFLLGALIVSRIFWEPYWIPSGSMKPTLLVGDYLVTTPVGAAEPLKRGNLYLFSHPVTGSTFVARLIAVEGDRVQMKDGSFTLNEQLVRREQSADFVEPYGPQGAMGNLPRCANGPTNVGEPCIKQQFTETLSDGTTYGTLDIMQSSLDNTGVYTVPERQLFFMGDNRDNSNDSRIGLANGGVGFVPIDNLVGKPVVVIFSSAGRSLGAFWTWRADRFLQWLN